MPKRIRKQYVENTARSRRKSIVMDDPSQWSVNMDNDENKIISPKPSKQMRYIKSNHNNEVERLLLFNSHILIHNVDHSDFPAFNVGMWPQETSDMLTNFPSYEFSVPRPIFVADKPCENIDICFKRPMNRYAFINRMRFSKTTYLTAQKINKNIRSCVKDGIYHSSIYDIAERTYGHADKYFQSSYDYYFTGGNLSVLPHQGRVIHTGGENLQTILASEFPAVNEYNDSDTIRTLASLEKGQGSEIFEIQPLITSLNNSRQNCFISRQENLIAFNHLIDNNKIKTITHFRTKSTPFISFAQSKHDIDNFIITTMKQHIRLYDLSSSAPKLVQLFEISPKEPNISWNSVKAWRQNTFLYANEKQFFLIDIRTSPEQWLKEVSLTNDSLLCDHMSAILPSEFNNLFYVATNHKLQCMDIRHLKKFSLTGTEGTICRWSHQLRYAPLMMDTFRTRQNEYIALSSPIAGDLHICQLSRERTEDNISLESSLPVNKHIYSSRCLPYQPPTLLEAYENARLSGKCIRPEASMEMRLKCCTTGMKFFNPTINSSRCAIGLLLISNSNGDVFAHTMSKREDKETEERCNGKSDEIMAEFEQNLCGKAKSSLKYSFIKNKRGLRKVFLCKPLTGVKKISFDDMDNEYNEDDEAAINVKNPQERKRRPKRFHLGRWQKPLSTLHTYKDALVPDLLSIWDIDIDEGKNIHLGKLRNAPKPDPAVKVENWLKNYIKTNPPPTVSIPFSEVATYNINQTSNIFESTLNISQNQNTIDFETAIHSTQILDNSLNNISMNFDTSAGTMQVNNKMATSVLENVKSKKKLKKYVKGF